MKTILHVGCGQQSHEILPPLNWAEWKQVRVDIDPSVGPDIITSIVDLSGIEDESAEAVFSKHNIEHLESHEVSKCLAAIYRVLKPEGFLILRTPDLKAIARLLLNHEPDETLYVSKVFGRRVPVAPLDMLYGSRQEVANGNRFMAHRTGFSSTSLRRYLLEAGFEQVDVSENNAFRELRCIAMKVVKDNLLPTVTGAASGGPAR